MCCLICRQSPNIRIRQSVLANLKGEFFKAIGKTRKSLIPSPSFCYDGQCSSWSSQIPTRKFHSICAANLIREAAGGHICQTSPTSLLLVNTTASGSQWFCCRTTYESSSNHDRAEGLKKESSLRKVNGWIEMSEYRLQASKE